MTKLQLTLEALGTILFLVGLFGFIADKHNYNDRENAWSVLIGIALIIGGIWI